MFKNQLQELAQRSCFNLPGYGSTREGPDHAPRFRACVNFNGEIFESNGYFPTLRQAEHAAAEVALNVLSTRGSNSLTARVLDETGVYKNLLQETAHKAGLNLPVYTTVRSGHVPVFICTVELAGMSFSGDLAKTKKQAEKNAAIAAWFSLKNMPSLVSKKEAENQHEEQEQEQDQVIVTRFLSNFRPKTGGKQHDHQRRSRNAKSWRSDNHLKHKPLGNNPEFPQKSDALKIKQNNFLQLLPPPPPRITSKMLSLTSSSGNKQGFDGKFLDDPNKKTRTALQEQGQTHFRSLFLGPSHPSTALKRMHLSCAQMGIMCNYSINPKGIAPAVQIRSIIPVCAAPPPSSSSTIQALPLKERSIIPLSFNPTLPIKETNVAAPPCSNPPSLPTKSPSDFTHLRSELSKCQLKGD